MPQGAFGLETPQDLLGKLRREFDKLRANPNDQDSAFNFFVTAEQMLDWLYPGNPNKNTREALRNAELLLQVVSHLASKSKHFDQLAAHHRSVGISGSVGPFFGGSFFGGGFFGSSRQLIHFKGQAARTFGESMLAVELAERVLVFWEAKCPSV
jgi:hypothetical protein